MPGNEVRPPAGNRRAQEKTPTDGLSAATLPPAGRVLSKSDRDQLVRLARQRARLAKQQVVERQKALIADVEDQLAAEYSSDEEIWRDITRQAKAEVEKADKRIADVCRSWGIPEEMRPHLNLSWYGRGSSGSAERRAELRRLAVARIESAGHSAKVTIDAKALDVETELVRDGLESAEAHAFLASMPSADDLMPRVDIGELDGKPERRPWEPDPKVTGQLLTPSGGSAREERRHAIERALTANPGASNREIARMVGVDHKTVGAARPQAGEIPTEAGEIPTILDDGGEGDGE
jgi:hypothetical protein